MRRSLRSWDSVPSHLPVRSSAKRSPLATSAPHKLFVKRLLRPGGALPNSRSHLPLRVLRPGGARPGPPDAAAETGAERCPPGTCARAGRREDQKLLFPPHAKKESPSLGSPIFCAGRFRTRRWSGLPPPGCGGRCWPRPWGRRGRQPPLPCGGCHASSGTSRQPGGTGRS